MDKAAAIKKLNYLLDTEEALCLVPQEHWRNYDYMHRHPEKFNILHPDFPEVWKLILFIVSK